MSIFISHSSKDNAAAKEIRDWLTSMGHDDIFLDFDKNDGISPGLNWKGTLAIEMKRAQIILLLISENWFASLWCQAEHTTATMFGKAIIPVLIQSKELESGQALAAGLATNFGELQYADLSRNRDDGFSQLERLLDRTRITPLAFPVSDGAPPFKGLDAYSASDAGLFFGREREIQETFEILKQISAQESTERLLVIRGASGAGKSSLLCAGLLPQLTLRPRDWIAIEPFIPEEDNLRRVSPLGGMAHAIAETLRRYGGSVTASDVENALRRDAAAETRRYITLLRSQAGAPNATVVLSVDQAEELLRATRSAAIELVQSIAHWVSTAGALAILTIRSDTFDEAEAQRFFETIKFREYPLRPIPLARIPEIISGPAKRVNLRLESALIDKATEDACTGDALPLLSFTLQCLFQKFGGTGQLSLENYTSLGFGTSGGGRISPVENSVRLAAEQALPNLSASQKRLLGEAFVPHLVDLTDALEPVRRRAALTAMPKGSRGLLRRLVEARLLKTERSGGVTTLEVSHEALLRRWPLLVDTIEASKPDLRLLQDTLRAADNWARDNTTKNREEHLTLRGARLRSALRLLGARSQWADRFAPAREYLAACRSLERRNIAEHRAQDERNLIQKQRLFAATADILRRDSRADGAMRIALAGDVDPASVKKGLTGDPFRYAQLARAAHEGRLKRMVGPFSSPIPAVSCSDTLVAAASHDGIAFLFDVNSGKQIRQLKGHSGRITGICVRSNVGLVITSSFDKTVRVWDLRNKGRDRTLSTSAEARCVDLSPDGRLIAVGCSDGEILVWDVTSAEPSGRKLRGHQSQVYGISFNSDGSELASAGRDRSVRVWDLRRMKALWVHTDAHDDDISSVAFGKARQIIASASYDQTVKIWDARNGAFKISLLGHLEQVRCVALSADCLRAATASGDGTVRIWDPRTGRELLRLGGHNGWVQSVAFDRRGGSVVSGGYDHTVRIWDVCATSDIEEPKGISGDVNAIAVSPDSNMAIVATKNGSSLLRNHDRVVDVEDISAALGIVEHLAITRSGRMLMAARSDGVVKLLSLPSFRLIRDYAGTREFQNPASISRTGDWVVTLGNDRTIMLWSRGAKRPSWTLPTDDHATCALALSPDGTRIAAARPNGQVDIWVPERMSREAQINTELGNIRRMVFCSAGDMLAIAGRNGRYEVHVYDVKTWRLIARLAGHQDEVWDLSFTGNGRRIATACRDRHVRIFDSNAGVITAEYFFPQQMRAVAIDAAGMFFVAGGTNGLVRLADSVFAAAILDSQLAAIVGHHRLAGVEHLTQEEAAVLSRFADPPDGGWPNLSRAVVERYRRSGNLNIGEHVSSSRLLKIWHEHREMAFAFETRTLERRSF